MKTYWIAASVVMAFELVAVTDVRAQATPKDKAQTYVQTSLEVAPSTRDEFAAFIKGEIAKWRKVAQTAGISLEY